jgi:integrase
MPKLTKRVVDGAEARQADYFLWDAELKGFGLRVMPSGRKTYLIQYRKGGRTRRLGLGQHGHVTPEQARQAAREALGHVARGDDPAEEVSIYRKAPTVAELCERFMAEHVAHRCKPTTQREYRRSVDLFVRPALGTMKVPDIRRMHVQRLHDDLRHIPYQANRTLGVLSKMFNLAEVWGIRPDGSNPCRHVKKYTESKRERIVASDELARLGGVLDAFERERPEMRPAVNAIRLLILTGCRLSEIQTLRWEHVQGHVLHLPDSKTGAKKVYLGRAALEVLSRIERLPDNPFVITGRLPGQHLTDLQRPWRRIRSRAGLPDLRIHDLRHNFASHAVMNGEGLAVIGKLLGHAQVQTTARYAHFADDPIRDAAERISALLAPALLAAPEDPDAQKQSSVASVRAS